MVVVVVVIAVATAMSEVEVRVQSRLGSFRLALRFMLHSLRLGQVRVS